QLSMDALAVGGDADHVAAPIVRVALPDDEAALLERVEECDETARVEPERVGDRRLRLAVALGEDGQDAVVAELLAGLLDAGGRLRLYVHAEACEQEAAALGELLCHPSHRARGDWLSGRNRTHRKSV